MAKKGRNPLPPAEFVGPEFVGATPQAMAEPEARMNTAIATLEANAVAVAKQFGYDGSLTVGALEDEIRFYQRRSVEACLELGKRLLILKELTPHGEFLQRIGLLGIEERVARRFMSATMKFSKRASTPVLSAAGSQTKLLELLTLDDDEIAALESGESARGLTLDAIETMSVRELRAALRESKEEKAALERLIADKNVKIDNLDKASRKKKPDPWPDEVDDLKNDIANLGKVVDEALAKHLTVIDALDLEIQKRDDSEDAYRGFTTVVQHLDAAVERICTLAAGLRHEYDTRLAGYIEIQKTYLLSDPLETKAD